MKILLDENLPLKLKTSFGKNYRVYSVREMGWAGVKNGELLQLMILKEFNIFITMDQNLPHQQNLGAIPLMVFILVGVNNKLETLANMMPLVLENIEKGIKFGVIRINN
jgi:predicted nuclease of predicted toxin-antitoxin system